MLNKVVRGIESSSTDSVQQGTAGSGSTAREIVIANERADEIKGLFYTQMKDLWIQKYVLRTQSVLLNYSDLKKVTQIVGEKKMSIFKNQFNLDNAQLSDGSMGMMQINVFESREKLPPQRENDIQEMNARMLGKNVEIINITSTFLDEWEYSMKIESESFKNKNKSLDVALMMEDLQMTAQLFPEIFQSNKDEFFRDYMNARNRDPEKYLVNVQKEQTEMSTPAGMSSGLSQGQTTLSSQMKSAVSSLGSLTGTGS